MSRYGYLFFAVLFGLVCLVETVDMAVFDHLRTPSNVFVLAGVAIAFGICVGRSIKETK